MQDTIMNTQNNTETPEHVVFNKIKHGKAITDLQFLEKEMEKHRKNSKLFDYLYGKTKEIYNKLAPRKNGEVAFIHPLNILYFLETMGITDETTLCLGLIHDLVEEKVDIYKDEEEIKSYKTGKQQMDEYEASAFVKLEKELFEFCEQNNIEKRKAEIIINGTKLLTRHKSNFYYKSIMNIFDSEDQEVKEKAIQVKLADRTHNILCIQCFDEEERNFQCFKNLFILNNTKIYLRKTYGETFFTENQRSETERLFTMCAKATYDAYLVTVHLSAGKGIQDLRSILQLAFKKFALEFAGVWEVTTLDPGILHPMRLYQDVILKFDLRVHRKWKKMDEFKGRQLLFCKKFFSDYNLSDEQIQAIIDYKDAYSLKEVVAYLLYLPEYVLKGFDTEYSVNEQLNGN